MEQIIPIIKFLKRNRFWLTCGAISIAAIVTWFLSTYSLHQQRVDRQKKIDGMINNANAIINTGSEGVDAPVAHPNDLTKRGMEEEIAKATDALLKAWKLRRDAQESVLEWPDISNKDFLTTFSTMRPAEKFIDELIAVNWETRLAVYKDEIPERMVEICDIIGAKWEYADGEPDDDSGSDSDSDGRQGGGAPAPTSGRGGAESGGSADGEYVELSTVIWARDNQQLWNEKLTQFKGRDGQDSIGDIPTPIQVIALQQDLWLLEALYRTIKEVNGDADANDLAVIKQIHHVVVGREARSQLGTLAAPNPMLAKVEETPEDARNNNTFANNNNNNAEEEKPFDPNPGAGLAKYSPFHGRYVDADFKPIPAKQLYDVLNSDKLPEEYLELLVAKRVPVRIAVRMDSQKIDDFIAACGNSDFAFEVWQVRIDRPRDPIQLASIGADGTFDTPAIAPSSSASDQGARGSGQRNDDGSVDDGSNPNAELDPSGHVHLRTTSDVDVEFYGIVKIYNPVNEEVITGADKKDSSVNPNPNPNP